MHHSTLDMTRFKLYWSSYIIPVNYEHANLIFLPYCLVDHPKSAFVDLSLSIIISKSKNVLWFWFVRIIKFSFGLDELFNHDVVDVVNGFAHSGLLLPCSLINHDRVLTTSTHQKERHWNLINERQQGEEEESSSEECSKKLAARRHKQGGKVPVTVPTIKSFKHSSGCWWNRGGGPWSKLSVHNKQCCVNFTQQCCVNSSKQSVNLKPSRQFFQILWPSESFSEPRRLKTDH